VQKKIQENLSPISLAWISLSLDQFNCGEHFPKSAYLPHARENCKTNQEEHFPSFEKEFCCDE